MVEYNKINNKLSDSKLSKLTTLVSNKTGATLRMNIKMFNETIYLMNYYSQQDKQLSQGM